MRKRTSPAQEGATDTKPRPWIGRKTLLKWTLGVCTLGVLVLSGLVGMVYNGAFGALPTQEAIAQIRTHAASEVYSADSVLLGRYYLENRVPANLDEMPPHLVDALVATEDARFFEHEGIDFRAWARVLVKSVLLADATAGGGSTLSQQLAKNLYPRGEHGALSILVNKTKEMFVARRLEEVYSKEELLRLYLNTVPFGEGVYGIKVAAQRFFHKDPDDLKVEEAAVLVGMLKANTRYNPARHPEQALGRRNTVLAQMKKYGSLDERTCDSLQQLPLVLDYQKDDGAEGTAAYFRAHLRQQVEAALKDRRKPDGSPYNLYVDGLKIYTTLDSRLQRYAEEAVGEALPAIQDAFDKDWAKGFPWEKSDVLDKAVKQSARYQALKAQGLEEAAIAEVFGTPVEMRVFHWEGGTQTRRMSPLDSIKHYLMAVNAGLLAIDPGTGAVKAWVGGINHQYFQYDHVLARRQMGSTFKPIVFAEVLNQGIRPCEYTQNAQVTYEQYKNWRPRNASGEYSGAYSMEGALSQSINTVTVALAMRAGLEPVRRLAKRMGVGGDLPANDPSILLGSADASLHDLVQVFGTLANRGRRPQPYYLLRVETAEGQPVFAPEMPDPERFERVLPTLHADMVAHMLKATTDQGTARRLRGSTFGIRGDVASKTGTTQNQSDGWFVGFTPHLVAAVWIGAESPHIHFRTMSAGQGSHTALPVWGHFMRRAQADPAFDHLRTGRLPSLPDTVRALMQCPHFLPDLPIAFDVQDHHEDVMRFNTLLEGLEGDLIDRVLQAHPRQAQEHLADYTQRIAKALDKTVAKDDRKARRKAFWDRVFFRDRD